MTMSKIKRGAARRLGLARQPRARIEICGPLSEHQARTLAAHFDRLLPKCPWLPIVSVEPKPGQRRGWWCHRVLR